MNELKVSLNHLPVQLGEHYSIEVTLVPDEQWDSGVMHLPVGEAVPLIVQLTALEDGGLAQVSGECRLVGECVRCLDPVEKHVHIEVSEVFSEAPDRSDHSKGWGKTSGAKASGDQEAANRDSRFNSHGIQVEGDELDAPYTIERNQIDLEPLLLDAILGESDYRPLCRPDCEGLCPHCGIKLVDAPSDHHHDFINPRFEALKGFFDQEQSEN